VAELRRALRVLLLLQVEEPLLAPHLLTLLRLQPVLYITPRLSK